MLAPDVVIWLVDCSIGIAVGASAIGYGSIQIYPPQYVIGTIHFSVDMRTDSMSDNPHMTDYRDHDRINIHQDHEVRYWSKELGVTPEILKDTVQKIGVMAADVRRELNKDA